MQLNCMQLNKFTQIKTLDPKGSWPDANLGEGAALRFCAARLRGSSPSPFGGFAHRAPVKAAPKRSAAPSPKFQATLGV